VTSASRHFSHMLNIIIDLVLLGFVCSYFWYQAYTKRRRSQPPSPWSIYGPAYLVTLGSCLILADPVRHVLQDLHVWHASMYIHACPVRALQLPNRSCTQPSDCGVNACGGGYFSEKPGTDCFTCWEDGMCSEGAETFRCLSTIGWVVTIFCNYVGFSLFLAAVLWSSNLLPKINRKWKALTSYN
jgi:hypothetical protein